MKASPEEIRARFERALEYLSDLESGQTAVVDSPRALALVARAASLATPEARDLLDVGSGAGNYALKLLQHMPHLNVTLLDLSDLLLERAHERVAAVTYGQVFTLQEDIRTAVLGTARFDVILAGSVLHHLRHDNEWENVFGKLYAALRVGGSLWISDLVAFEAPKITELMMSVYGEYLMQLGGAELRNLVFREIADQDSPRPLAYQLDLLRRVGFRAVDVLHQNACFATFGALKGAT